MKRLKEFDDRNEEDDENDFRSPVYQPPRVITPPPNFSDEEDGFDMSVSRKVSDRLSSLESKFPPLVITLY